MKIKTFPGFEDINIRSFLHSFVPYLYLDGHRSSNIGDTDLESYKSGFQFFHRFGKIMKEMGFKNMVTMVHTTRNCYVKRRLDSIQTAILNSFDSLNGEMEESAFKLYGDIELYKNIGRKSFYDFLKTIDKKTKRKVEFTHHILINYSEKWALDNIEKISSIPPVSSVIRFTKGFVSGGWIPIKMQETTFVYSQIPSVSEFWSDDAIKTLIFIALKNWSVMVNYIGKKSYKKGEVELIHNDRDLELKLSVNKLETNTAVHNRIIAFGIDGPILYEL